MSSDVLGGMWVMLVSKPWMKLMGLAAKEIWCSDIGGDAADAFRESILKSISARGCKGTSI